MPFESKEECMQPLEPLAIRVRLSLSQKIKLIQDSTKPGFNRANTAKEYGISLPCLCKILKNKTVILNSINKGSISSKKIISKPKNDVLEEKLYEWYLQNENNELISGVKLKAKAEELSKKYSIPVRFSNGWLEGKVLYWVTQNLVHFLSHQYIANFEKLYFPVFFKYQ